MGQISLDIFEKVQNMRNEIQNLLEKAEKGSQISHSKFEGSLEMKPPPIHLEKPHNFSENGVSEKLMSSINEAKNFVEKMKTAFFSENFPINL